MSYWSITYDDQRDAEDAEYENTEVLYRDGNTIYISLPVNQSQDEIFHYFEAYGYILLLKKIDYISPNPSGPIYEWEITYAKEWEADDAEYYNKYAVFRVGEIVYVSIPVFKREDEMIEIFERYGRVLSAKLVDTD